MFFCPYFGVVFDRGLFLFLLCFYYLSLLYVHLICSHSCLIYSYHFLLSLFPLLFFCGVETPKRLRQYQECCSANKVILIISKANTLYPSQPLLITPIRAPQPSLPMLQITPISLSLHHTSLSLPTSQITPVSPDITDHCSRLRHPHLPLPFLYVEEQGHCLCATVHMINTFPA